MNKPWLPPEWHSQSGVMITWPHADGAWSNQLQQVDLTFACLGFHITQSENLLIICSDSEHQNHIENCLLNQRVKLHNVIFHHCHSNDSWARDHGPITVIQQQRPQLLSFEFNGWGNKYPAELDNKICKSLHEAGVFNDLPLKNIDFVLEGGAIETDGQGTLLCTKNSVLNPNRTGYNQHQVEQLLTEQLGVQRFLWMQHGHLKGDDTDSHVDTLARFCNENLIVYQGCHRSEDEHFDDLKKMAAELSQFRNFNGAPYELQALPLPLPKYNDSGQRLPASYANFLIVNHAVLVPTYNDPNDDKALDILSRCFKQREIIGIDSMVLIEQFGSLHCVTMQLPQNTLRHST